MKRRRPVPNKASFRVPNSIIQGLTTSTVAGLNQLSPFPMTVLLGLLSLVDPDRPEEEVQARPSDFLEIMEVSRQVAHVVDRTWVTATGEHKRQHYPARRYSPKALQQVQEALLALHDQKVQIRRKDPKTGKGRDDLVVHLLDMYGFRYEEEGKPLDVFDPPPGRVKVNVGTVDRPVWRLRRQTAEEDCDERPSGVIFRISKELASEMCGVKGSIKFTLLARRIFGLLRHFSHDPIGIRLLLLVVRQTGEEFSRRLDKLLGDLGFDPEHRARNLDRLQRTLEDLQGKGLIQGYAVDLERDEVQVRRNPSWFQDRMALEVG